MNRNSLPRLRIALPLLLAALLMFVPRHAAAQGRPAPLEGFMGQVARLWAAGDAGGIAALARTDDRIVLDLGTGDSGAVEARHAAAALRELFRDRANLSARVTQVTIAGGQPLSGFGEVSWSSRPRGVSDTENATVYVGAVWDGGAWRIRELRVMR